MSRDLTPRECLRLHNSRKEENLFLSNMRFSSDGEHWEYMYSEEELEDRKKYPYIAILGSDIYKELRRVLSDKQFERLNADLEKLASADMAGNSTSDFPKEMTDWYYNRHKHWYSEPNNQEFMEFVLQEYR